VAQRSGARDHRELSARVIATNKEKRQIARETNIGDGQKGA
jgi:hypothetical protein